jgi:formylglycine-generating enzyme required for sulfatase activity
LGEGLVEAVLDDAGAVPAALAATAVALRGLWDWDWETGCLSLRGYRAIGGVGAALMRWAEIGLEPVQGEKGYDPDATLGRIFTELVDVSDRGLATRRRVRLSRIGRGRWKKKVVNGLIDAGVIVSAEHGAEQPEVELVHEALFLAWPRLRRWIEREVVNLRSCRDLERAALDWREAGQPMWRGLPAGRTLKRYRGVARPSDLGRAFLRAGRRRAWLRRALLGVSTLLLCGVGVFGWRLPSGNLNSVVIIGVFFAEHGLYTVKPDMVTIPAGKYMMGSPEDEPDRDANEHRQEVVIERPFLMGRYEVTFDEYEIFARVTGRIVPDDGGWGRGRRPVVNVSWGDAIAYAEWLSARTGHRYRLPTEAEWEYAARAGTATRYWWGDEMRSGMANCNGCGGSGEHSTAPVGSFPANAFGLHDTAGNVWEWTCSPYAGRYAGLERQCFDEDEHGQRSLRTIRGGSWKYGPPWARSANRSMNAPALRSDNLGFRLVREL